VLRGMEVRPEPCAGGLGSEAAGPALPDQGASP